jgi:phosphatidylglycerophosphatase A
MTANIRQIWCNPWYFLAFGFGSGTLPKCPGTWGTLMAIPLYYVIAGLPLHLYLAIIAMAIVLGIWLCHVTARDLGVHDHPGIVWDEIVGFAVTMIALPPTWVWVMAGFILFRIFDIWKPWPINWLDRHVKGGLGIMLDDLLAAVYAGGILQIFLWYYHNYH